MKIVLLLPAILYMIIILSNINLLSLKENINLLWVYNFDVYIIGFVTLFFVTYILFIWIILKFTNIFSNYKNKKLEKEIWELKSKLLDWQDILINNIKKEFSTILKKFVEDNSKKINAYKNENSKIITNLEYKIDSFTKKIDKLKK